MRLADLRRTIFAMALPLALLGCAVNPGATASSTTLMPTRSESTSTTPAPSTTTTTTTPAVAETTARVAEPDPSTEAASGTLAAATEATSGTVALATELDGEIPADTPDPSLVQDGAVYLVYSTNTSSEQSGAMYNVPVRASFDLVHWTDSIDALPKLPQWAEEGYTWAPTVKKLNDTWVMYFAARDRSSGLECIGVATSRTSNGPFVSTSDEPAVCQTDLGGSIDPEIFVSTNAGVWLLWKNDGNCCGRGTSIWAAPIEQYGMVSPTSTRLLSATRSWQHGVIENPTLLETSAGFLLLYSGGRWNDRTYGTGFALCSTLSEPCADASSQPMFDDSPGTYGSGGASLTTLDDGRVMMIWHAWNKQDAQRGRSARIARLLLT